MAQEAKEKLYPVKLTHAYFPGPGYIDETTGLVVEEKIKPGTVIEVPVEVAMKLIEQKKAERADPLQ